MDAQTLFNAIISIASVLGGIMLKSIYDAIQELRTQDGDLHERINALPNMYMRRDDFINFGTEIKATLIRIEGKLDGKQDK
jgi:hypothetical protein